MVAWRDLAESLQHLTKGAPVMIQGRPTTQRWTDEQGNQQTRPKIEATEVRALVGRMAAPAPASQTRSTQTTEAQTGKARSQTQTGGAAKKSGTRKSAAKK